MADSPGNPIRTARRATELRQRLGSECPRCIYCGCAELPLLTLIRRPLLEEHHVAGRSHDPALTVYACRNCHATFHENALDQSVGYEPEPDPVRRTASVLLSLAVHFDMLAKSIRRWAAELKESRK